MLLTPILRLCFRIKIEGREFLPTSGPVIVAANHRSFLDSIFLPLVLKRRITFVAKAEYFDDPKTAWLFRAVGQIPIRREGGSASQGALAAAADVLNDGGLFGIYPEGTRTRDGVTHRGHTGIARLALETGAPIVPVGLIGSEDCMPTGAKFPHLFRTVRIRFGAPMDFRRYADRANDRLTLRQITDEVMFEIFELSGYEYRNTYATKPGQEAGAHDMPAPVVKIATLEPVAC